MKDRRNIFQERRPNQKIMGLNEAETFKFFESRSSTQRNGSFQRKCPIIDTTPVLTHSRNII
jgi:hypothetical protein